MKVITAFVPLIVALILTPFVTGQIVSSTGSEFQLVGSGREYFTNRLDHTTLDPMGMSNKAWYEVWRVHEVIYQKTGDTNWFSVTNLIFTGQTYMIVEPLRQPQPLPPR